MSAPPPPPLKLPPPIPPKIRNGEVVDTMVLLKQKQPELEAKEDLPDEILYAPKTEIYEKVKCPRCEKLVLENEFESHTISHSSEIYEFLYLGGQRNAANKPELVKRTQVFNILNLAEEVEDTFTLCTEGCECMGGGNDCNGRDGKNTKPKWFSYHTLKIKDLQGEDIYHLFDECYTLIEKVRTNNEKILVHCVAGISRSASVVIAYCMRSNSWCLKKAFEYVRSKRPIVSPIGWFILQLQKYEAHLAQTQTLDGYAGTPSLLVTDIYPEGKQMIGTGVTIPITDNH
jgi:phage FluMu protein Com